MRFLAVNPCSGEKFEDVASFIKKSSFELPFFIDESGLINLNIQAFSLFADDRQEEPLQTGVVDKEDLIKELDERLPVLLKE